MNVTKKDIENFLNSDDALKLGKLYEKYIDEENEFDLLSVFDDLLNENAWSRLFAYLMDSNKNHGLGNQFFDAFIQIGAENSPDLKRFFNSIKRYKDYKVSVDTEWLTKYKRRIDMLVKVISRSGDLIGVVGIENKVFAGEQPEQVTSYQKSLATTFKKVPRVLIYLSLDNRKSITKDDSNNECLCVEMGYSHIKAACNNIEGANKQANIFLKVLSKHIIKIMKKQEYNKALANAVQEIYKDESKRSIIDAIFQNLPGTNRLIDMLYDKLIELDWISQRAKKHDDLLTYHPQQGNPFEFKINLPELYNTEIDLGVTYILISDVRNPEIGSEFQLKIGVWRKDSKYKTEEIREKFELDNSESELKKSSNGFWVYIWSGGKYFIQDYGKKDVEGLIKLFKSAYDKTYKPLLKICREGTK